MLTYSQNNPSHETTYLNQHKHYLKKKLKYNLTIFGLPLIELRFATFFHHFMQQRRLVLPALSIEKTLHPCHPSTVSLHTLVSFTTIRPSSPFSWISLTTFRPSKNWQDPKTRHEFVRKFRILNTIFSTRIRNKPNPKNP